MVYINKIIVRVINVNLLYKVSVSVEYYTAI